MHFISSSEEFEPTLSTAWLRKALWLGDRESLEPIHRLVLSTQLFFELLASLFLSKAQRQTPIKSNKGQSLLSLGNLLTSFESQLENSFFKLSISPWTSVKIASAKKIIFKKF